MRVNLVFKAVLVWPGEQNILVYLPFRITTLYMCVCIYLYKYEFINFYVYQHKIYNPHIL